MRKQSFRVFSILFLAVNVVLALSSDTFAFLAWKGVILDKETGNPIEGAVVVRSWDRVTTGPGGAVSGLLAVKETLSDKDGKFMIAEKLPSLSIPGLSWVEENSPLVYKPGYKFLVVRNNPRTIELIRVPTFPSLRKKELNKAREPNSTVLFRDLIEKETDFIESSLYLIDAQPLIDSLKDTSPRIVRKQAVNLLAKTLDPRATDSLIGVLGDKNWLVELEAIKALGKRKDPRAVEALISALGGSSYTIEPSHAARALVGIGTPAVEALCAALRDGGSRCRADAAWILGEIKDDRAVEPLMNALHDTWSKVRWKAAEALGKINEKRAAEALITIALRDNDRKVRQRAAEALEKISYRTLKVLCVESQDKVLDVGIPATVRLDNEVGFGAGQLIEHEIGSVKDEDVIVTIPPPTGLGTGLARNKNAQGIRTSVPLGSSKNISGTREKGTPAKAGRKLRSIVYIAAELENKHEGARKIARLTFGKTKNPQNIRDNIALLKRSDWRIRRMAVRKLADIQDFRCVPPLIDALKDENNEVRLSAAVALGRIKHPLAIRYLISALNDEETFIREKAANALAEINNTIVLVPVVKTVDNLAVGMKTPVALVRFKDSWIEDQLIAAMRDENVKDRYHLVNVLGKVRRREASDRLIATTKVNGTIRSLAFQALAQIGEPSIEPLIVALKDKNANGRWYAAHALGEIKDARAVEALIVALQDEDSHVRWHSAWALGKIGDARAVEPLISASLRDGQSKVRKQALEALVDIGAPAVEQLIRGLKDVSSYSRWRAAWALGRIGATEAVDPLVNALIDEVSEVRWFASVALGEIRDPKAIAPLDALRNDEDLGIKSCAEFSLKRIIGNKTKSFDWVPIKRSSVKR